MNCEHCGGAITQLKGVKRFKIKIEGKNHSCETGMNPYYCRNCDEYYLSSKDIIKNIIKIKKRMMK